MRPKGPYVLLYAGPTAIQTLMTLRGIATIRALALAAGVSPETARRFVSGEMVDVAESNAEKFAKALRVDMSYLFIKRRNTVALEDLAA